MSSNSKVRDFKKPLSKEHNRHWYGLFNQTIKVYVKRFKETQVWEFSNE